MPIPLRTRNRMAASAVAAALVLATSACTPGDRTADEQTLTWAVVSTPRSLDIAHGFTDASTTIQFAVLDTVVKLDPNGTVVPSIAESWSQPDELSYEFTIRPGVTFSDGTPLTAEDVAYSLLRHTDPEVASQAASYVSMVESVQADDDDTVTVRLNRPSTTFLYTAALAWQVVPKALAEAHPKDLGSPEVGTLGTGPYQVENYSLTSGVSLIRNEHYWGDPAPMDRILVRSIGDAETLRFAVESGEVQGTADFDDREARKWVEMAGVATQFVPINLIAFLSLDTTTGPLADVHVRRAIARAVDKESIVKLMTDGRGDLASLLLPQPQLDAVYGDDIPSFGSDTVDLAAAKAELAQSPYPDGFRLEAPYPSGGDASKAMQVIAENLARIGITVELVPLTGDLYSSRMMDHDDMGIQFVTLSYGTPDPGEVLPDLLSSASAEPQGFNFAGFASSDLDQKLAGVEGLAGAERAAAVTDVLELVNTEVPYLPLYYSSRGVALSERYEFTAPLTAWTQSYLQLIAPREQ